MSASPPAPSNRAEAGLAELWARTVPAMSPGWRRRFVTVTHNLMVESMWELENIDAERVANPIEYLQMRRRVGGAPWSACLVEYATGAEVPARFAATRPLEVLRDSFSDAVHLRNDLFSHQKEVQFEGELHNMVVVTEQFLGLDRRSAAQVVANLMAERMMQFERPVADGLPALAEQEGLDAAAQAALRRRARLLRDYMAGVLAWHRATPRYTDTGLRATYLGFQTTAAGLGTAATRIPATT